MYAIIKNMDPVRNVYRKKLIELGIPEATLDKIDKETEDELEEAYRKSKNLEFEVEEWGDTKWTEIKTDTEKYGKLKDTGVDISVLRDIGNKISTLPPDGNFHPQIVKIF